MNVLGQSTILLSSYEDAVDLLDKKGPMYSYRPDLLTVQNISLGSFLVCLQYGDVFKESRKLVNTILGKKERHRFHGLIDPREVRIRAWSLCLALGQVDLLFFGDNIDDSDFTFWSII